ncbi:terbinafine resistance locus protein (yip1) [Angomonas deanei]|nr:terbinafine resistance locus protein (yip1) [Angomonas deanei]|eukprot:EPY41067.1 terbinafine resistance locus protein (yip1) [Angomonas deanei]
MVVVVYPPFGDDRELREWDLWGPLLLCLLLAIILAVKAGQDQKALVFSAVFLWVWLGAAVVTLNAKFLGSTISFFQTVCVMGYCLTPLFLGALLVLVIPIFFINLVIVMATWAWSCWASLRFFRGSTVPQREMLVLYPVALFFFFGAWMILVGL